MMKVPSILEEGYKPEETKDWKMPIDWKLLVYRIRRNKRNKIAKLSRRRNRNK